MTRANPLLAAASLLAANTLAQAPILQMDPSVVVTMTGATANHQLQAPAGALFGVFADVAGGPIDLLGERLYLGLTPAMIAIHSGVVPSGGLAQGSLHLPFVPGVAGLVLYGQAVVLDANAPNGLFLASNGASSLVHTGPGAVVATFDNLAGYTGSFAADVAGHLRGGAVTHRTYVTVDPQGIPFSIGIRSPLDGTGCREQMVYRPQNLGATGEPELIVGIAWRREPSTFFGPDFFPWFELRAGHTDVVPDYTIDSFSSLPVFPNSGLDQTFAANERPGAPPQLLFQGSYTVDPAAALPGGYVPFPLAAPFAYDGVSSLLLDFRTHASPSGGINGSRVWLMVQSTAQPNSRVVAHGAAGAPIDPDLVTSGTGDNAMHELLVEFARVETSAQSPWLSANLPGPDYGTPVIAQSLPWGTSMTFAYRGASNSSGANATAWSPSPDVADGMPYLQFRVVFHSNLLTGERPVLDTLVVPVI